MRQGFLIALTLIAAASAFAAEEAEWQSIIVRFDIDRDGKLHITEQVQVDVPPSVQRLERTYWSDAEQQVTFDKITLYDTDRTVPLEDSGDLDRAHHFRQSEWPGKVVWSVRDKSAVPERVRSLTYVIESQVSDAVIPAWSIPRGKLSHDSSGQIGDPRRRLREVIPLWREALKNPRHRFLADYQFEMPPPSTKGTQIQLQIYWPAGWNPVHEITPDTVARPIERDAYNPDQWRITHLFEEDGRHLLTGIDEARHAIRMGAMIGFPIVALLFWLFYVLLELLRRPRIAEDGEQLVRELYREPPEVVEAVWSGRAPYVSIEQFLRRMERERKLSINIEKLSDDDDEDYSVTLRLLVPREQLTPYERAGIQMLVPEGWEATSEDIRRRHKELGFDAGSLLRVLLTAMAAASKRRERAPWYSRLTSFALFITGIYFAFQETVRLGHEPVVIAATLICCSMIFSIWPSSIARAVTRESIAGTLLLLIPLVILTAIVIAIHFAGEVPPGYFASAGLSLAFLGTYKAILAGSATRDSPEIARFARARRWLRNELKSNTPRLRDDAIPWLNALGLSGDIDRWRRRNQTAESRFASSGWTGNLPPEPEEDEDWGTALMT